MWYRANQIKIKINEDKDLIPGRLKEHAAANGAGNIEIIDWKIAKESIDARNNREITFVYTVDFEVADSGLDMPRTPDLEYKIPEHGIPEKRPVIVGMGPCGIFSALIMSQMGMRPILLERGRAIEDRVRDVALFREKGIIDPDSNVQFGEGGAGTFSDGKLTTGIRDDRITKVLEEFAAAGGGEELLYKNKPHIGTDKLRGVIKNLRSEIEKNGGEVRFGSKMTGLIVGDGKIRGVNVSSGDAEQDGIIETDDLILAVGHSARDTFSMLQAAGIDMEQKPFSIGVRIEHPQAMINKAQYKKARFAKILGAADYKLSWHCKNGRGVYTFCMCPGGEVIVASSEEGEVVTNGMSYNARDGKCANSALLVSVNTSDFDSDDPLAGVEFQRKYERLAYEKSGGYRAPETKWKDFKGSDVEDCLPGFASAALIEAMPKLGRKLKGFDSPDAVMRAVETRSSSPVRMPRNEKLMSNIEGLYPGGEGAGHAGGIVSSAVDGIRIAEAVGKRYRQIK